MTDQNYQLLLFIPLILVTLWTREVYLTLSSIERVLIFVFIFGIAILTFLWFLARHSDWGRDRQKNLEIISSIPSELLCPSHKAVSLGMDRDLEVPIYLPDQIRTRHIHILGATGSGKTESVVLNFLCQDLKRELGAIILDAKGDETFLEVLKANVRAEKLQVFDLGSTNSAGYDPLESGNPLESAQRLFSSFTWSEEYYKSKALSVLQRIFQVYFDLNTKNPQLIDLAAYLESPAKYCALVVSDEYPKNLALEEFKEISGLRDQIRSLVTGHLKKTLSPPLQSIRLDQAYLGQVIYFRLQSLMSPQIVGTVGRLIINNLNFLAGTAHRGQVQAQVKERKLVPVYLDEFASFACAEFADLISKARSAGFALHFSHQSIGDLTEVSPGFINRITDNSATKIVLRINDPDSAEFFARSFGTRLYTKATQRVTNAKDIERSELVGEGTVREAHQFRASPDLLKTLPTGVGAVLIAHGRDSPDGASHVFTIRFPALKS